MEKRRQFSLCVPFSSVAFFQACLLTLYVRHCWFGSLPREVLAGDYPGKWREKNKFFFRFVLLCFFFLDFCHFCQWTESLKCNKNLQEIFLKQQAKLQEWAACARWKWRECFRREILMQATAAADFALENLGHRHTSHRKEKEFSFYNFLFSFPARATCDYWTTESTPTTGNYYFLGVFLWTLSRCAWFLTQKCPKFAFFFSELFCETRE